MKVYFKKVLGLTVFSKAPAVSKNYVKEPFAANLQNERFKIRIHYIFEFGILNTGTVCFKRSHLLYSI